MLEGLFKLGFCRWVLGPAVPARGLWCRTPGSWDTCVLILTPPGFHLLWTVTVRAAPDLTRSWCQLLSAEALLALCVAWQTVSPRGWLSSLLHGDSYQWLTFSLFSNLDGDFQFFLCAQTKHGGNEIQKRFLGLELKDYFMDL